MLEGGLWGPLGSGPASPGNRQTVGSCWGGGCGRPTLPPAFWNRLHRSPWQRLCLLVLPPSLPGSPQEELEAPSLPCKLASPHNGRDEIPYLTGTPDPNAARLPQLCSRDVMNRGRWANLDRLQGPHGSFRDEKKWGPGVSRLPCPWLSYVCIPTSQGSLINARTDLKHRARSSL